MSLPAWNGRSKSLKLSAIGWMSHRSFGSTRKAATTKTPPTPTRSTGSPRGVLRQVWEREALYPIPNGFTLKWKAKLPCPRRTVHTEGLDIVILDGDQINHNEVRFDSTPWRQALGEEPGQDHAWCARCGVTRGCTEARGCPGRSSTPRASDPTLARALRPTRQARRATRRTRGGRSRSNRARQATLA